MCLTLSDVRATLTSPPLGSDLRGPVLDFLPKPQLDATVAELAHRTGHIVVPVLIDADGVSMTEAQERCHAAGVEKILRADSG